MDTEEIIGYQLEIGGFKGPLDKLLELIDERKLEITRLNLAEVTADFLIYLEKLEEVSHKELANFVVIGARLILIKSYALLPNLELTQEEEADIAELEKRLKLYKEFRQVEDEIQLLWNQKQSFARPFLATIPNGFYLTEKIIPSQLENNFKQLVQVVEELKKLETEEVRIINLEEKIGELMTRISSIVQTSFKDLSNKSERPEVVVMFLALLHLLKDNHVNVVQGETFGEITISITNG